MGGAVVTEGVTFASVPAALAVALAARGHRAAAAASAVLATYCLWFFRDPDRAVPDGPVCVSPADGRVVAVRPLDNGTRRVSIYLSLLDVHVNRAPITGTITDIRYQPGRFFVASKDAASQHNEQNVLTVTGDGTTVVFRQIAGIAARRIVCWKRPADAVARGERVGLIRFGSRVDVELGPEWRVDVAPGTRVKAGGTVLATRRDAPA